MYPKEKLDDLGKIVAAAIKQEMEAKSLTSMLLAIALHESFQISVDGTYNHIKWVVKHEQVYGTTSTRVIDRDKMLYRLAAILYALGFDVNHELMPKIKELPGNFKYTPDGSPSYEEVKNFLAQDPEILKGLMDKKQDIARFKLNDFKSKLF